MMDIETKEEVDTAEVDTTTEGEDSEEEEAMVVEIETMTTITEGMTTM